MARLTNADLTAYKHALRHDPQARQAMRNAALSKSEWTAGLQGIEDWFEAQRPLIKAAIEAGIGHPIPPILARKLVRVWMEHKFGGE
jgi:hypothetical protein